VPQESILEIRGWAEGVLKAVRERKTPSAIVERQMLPRQTKRTETFLGEGSVIVVVLLEGSVVVVVMLWW